MKNILIILGIVIGILFFRIDYMKKEITSLESKNIVFQTNLNKANAQTKAFKEELDERNKKILALCRERETLRRSANSDKSGMDWSKDLYHSEPMLTIRKLHESRISIH